MITPKKIYSYIQGWTRYYMYYGDFRNQRLVDKTFELYRYSKERPLLLNIRLVWNNFTNDLLPSHIRQQIDIRIKSSLPCILEGQCKICKCSTPALQMADKACDKPCYPAMLSKKDWEEFYGSGEHTPIKWHLDKTTNLEWTIFDNKFVNKQDYISKKFLNNNHE